MTTPATTPERRRLDIEQAIASTRIEGIEPDADFLRDCDAYIDGSMSLTEVMAAAAARAVAAEAEADRRDAEIAAAARDGH